jgi:uncharacterized membrane protein YbhN (UPF0104 family)
MKHNTRIWQRVLRVVGLILGLSLFGIQLINAVRKSLDLGAQSFNWSYIICAFTVMMLIYYLQVRIWLSSMRIVGSKISIIEAVKGYWISFIPRYIPGSIWGYLGRSEWLFRDFGIPIGVTNLGSIFEVVVIVVGGLSIIFLTTPANSPLFVKLAMSGATIALTGIVFARLSDWPIVQKINSAQKLLAFPIDGLQIKHWFIGTAYSILNWILYGLVIMLCLLSMSPILPQPFWELIIKLVNAFSISWLIGFIIVIVPGGLGIREFVLSALLSTSLGLQVEVTTRIAIVVRVLTLFAEMIWIFIGLSLVKKPTRNL